MVVPYQGYKPPCSSLHILMAEFNQTHLIAVEDQHLSSEHTPQGLDGLRLSRACRPIGVPPQPHEHALGQGQVALVSEGRVHQLGGVALVLVRVRELGINHTDLTHV